LSLVTTDDMMRAYVAAWPTSGTFAGVRLFAHAKPPNETAASWAVLTVAETGEPKTESDGLTEQTFRVEIAVWSRTNPPPVASFAAGLVLLYDGTNAAPGAGLTLSGAGQTVTLAKPGVSAIRRESERRAGADVLCASRAWTVTTNASQ
jgi:hypothetical protein